MDIVKVEDSHDYLRKIDKGDIVPARTFYRLKEVDVFRMLYMAEQMKKTLYSLADGTIPGEEYTLEDLKTYCISLVEGQYRFHTSTGLRPGGWPLTEEVRMPGDARVDFIFFPTYIAVATLSRVLLDYPDIALQIKGYGWALVSGQLFSTHRGLNGHGYDATSEMLKALEIFCKGGVPRILNEYPDFAHRKLRELVDKIEKRLVKALATGNTIAGFGGDYRNEYEKALEALAVSRQ